MSAPWVQRLAERPPVAPRVSIGEHVGAVLAAALVASCGLLPSAPSPVQPPPGAPTASPTQPPQIAHWIALPDAPISGRTDYAAAWTGTELFVWGGLESTPDGGQQSADTGALFSPSTGTWRRTKASPLSPRAAPAAVALDGRVLLWGGLDASTGAALRDGALYDPAGDEWSTLKEPPLGPEAIRTRHLLATPASVLLLAGGDRLVAAELDPRSLEWTRIDVPGGHRRADLTAAAWTGEVAVWAAYSATGGPATVLLYNPSTDEWRELSRPPLSAYAGTPLLWTGREVVTFGGDTEPPFVANAAYDPVTDGWRELAGVDGCTTLGAVAADELVISLDPPQTFDVVRQRCDPLPELPERRNGGTATREGVVPVWTGRELIVWSGSTGRLGVGIPPDGVAYLP